MNAKAVNQPAELEERLRFEALIIDLSLKFVQLPAGDVDREIMDAERRICTLLGLDFVVVWQVSDEAPGLFALTHFFSAQAGPQAPDRMRQAQYPWATEQLLAGRTIKVASLDDLPPEAASDRETLRQFGIQSNLALPLSVGGESPVGVLGLGTTTAERGWPDDLVKRLQLVAQVFAQALARKRAGRALRESEERVALAAEAAELGLWVWNIAGDEVWGSPRWRRLFGFTSAERVGFPQVIQRIHPDDRGTVEREVRRAVAERIDYAGEFRALLPDGTQRWVLSRGRGQADASGTPARMLGAALDITERKRTEEALRTSEARLAAGTELAGLGYYEVDYVGRTCFLDDRFREICGVPADLRDGLDPVQFWLEHVQPEDHQLLFEERQKLHGGDVDRIALEYRYLHPAKGQRWLHHSARVAWRSAGGAGIRTFGVLREITEFKRAEEAARDLSGRLLRAQETERARIAKELHDGLSQNLALLSIELEMFGQRLPKTSGQINARLAEFSRQTKALSAEVHRIAHGLHPAKLTQLGLVVALKGFSREVETAHGIAVRFEARDVPRTLPEDVALCLYRVTQEAIQNVVKHSGADQAQVEVFALGHALHLIITDDGKGFAVGGERDTGSLGLVSMQERVRLLHGEIAVNSGPGEGTRVEVRVPISPMAAGGQV